MRSWCDVERDHIPPHAWNNSRMDNPILIKFNIGEFYGKLSKHASFNLDQTILTTT
jgi:hypothetical protein